MSPEQQPPAADKVDAAEPEPAGAEPADDRPAPAPEKVTELPPSVEVKQGAAPAEALDQLRPVCSLADQKYQLVLSLIKDIKAAQDVLRQFQSRQGNISPADVDEAKKKFQQAKQSYLQAGNQINAGIKQVYTTARTYVEDILVQANYRTYLAKLLASLETRNPTELYVARFAADAFAFERTQLTLLDEEQQRGMTLEKKQQEALEAVQKTVVSLETRYRKRQLGNRLRQGEKPEAILSHLRRLLKADPMDLHTYIWIGHLMTQELEKLKNQNKRVELRDGILEICKRAFALIDDFLDLQGITTLADRDRRRAEYVKTITAIRKPLMGRR
ncbi:MAG: hypothetical protein HY423_13355 [Candidatus Lambdaproteobacteria bacterium]|nr:hypothetical protein [Candidatus Lambdaproteobacteria bacterium]